ncbi:MAG: universal stress protein [Deltaproteobacteria bacterium]|nr:MAG: universal stress protein [Deltaproteobacteria bacterium]
MFSKILLPVDLSEPSRLACEYAINLARVFDSRIIVLHVIDESVTEAFSMSGLEFENFRETSVGRAREALDAFVEENFRGFENYDVLLEMGNPPEVIIETAEKKRVSLIVMASHGRTGIERVLFGSVAEKVVRLAPCPVFTVRERKS